MYTKESGTVQHMGRTAGTDNVSVGTERSSGKLFQSWAWAAATGKARPPTVESLTGDTTRRLESADRYTLCIHATSRFANRHNFILFHSKLAKHTIQQLLLLGLKIPFSSEKSIVLLLYTHRSGIFPNMSDKFSTD